MALTYIRLSGSSSSSFNRFIYSDFFVLSSECFYLVPRSGKRVLEQATEDISVHLRMLKGRFLIYDSHLPNAWCTLHEYLLDLAQIFRSQEYSPPFLRSIHQKSFARIHDLFGIGVPNLLCSIFHGFERAAGKRFVGGKHHQIYFLFRASQRLDCPSRKVLQIRESIGGFSRECTL